MQRIRESNSSFDKLYEDLQIEILKRVHGKDASMAMCVSHTWRDIILQINIPRGPLGYFVRARSSPHPMLHLKELFSWFSRVMQCSISPRTLIDTCNGLYLFCHKDGKAKNLIHDIYHYYVVNRVTKQCIAILKPVGMCSAGYSYAALAYDPTHSRFFKIMRFQGRRHVNIFSSKKGNWKTLTINLPKEINEARWIKKSVYKTGVIYRLSRSGHLIKFMVNRQETVEKQAIVLALPPACLLKRCHWDIGVRRNKLVFAMSIGAYFLICELHEYVERGVTSHKWVKICSIRNQELWYMNSSGERLSFHPYHSLAIIKTRGSLYLFYVDGSNFGRRAITYGEVLNEYIRHCGLPLLECRAAFSCTLKKEDVKSIKPEVKELLDCAVPIVVIA